VLVQHKKSQCHTVQHKKSQCHSVQHKNVPVPLSPTQKCHSATQSNTKMSQCHSAQRKMSQCHCVTTVPCMNCPRSEPCTDSVWPIKSHSTDDKHNPTFTNSFTAVVSLCKRWRSSALFHADQQACPNSPSYEILPLKTIC